MAVTASGLFVPTFVATLNGTQLALDLTLTTHKLALFTNTVTPNFTTDTAYAVAPYNANEVSGTGWSAGGVALTGTTFVGSAGTAIWDANDVSQPTTTLANARCALIYADALAGNNAICLVDFGADYSTTAGTLGITWATGGIFVWDLTP
jgi:hypothetical protein